MFQLHFSLRKRSGRRQPLAERSPVLSLEHKSTTRYYVEYQVPDTGMYVCVLVLLLSSLIVSFISALFAMFSSQITPVLPIRT